MKSLQEFEQFLATDQALVSDLTQLETQRKSTKNSFFIILLLAIVFVAVVGYFMYRHSTAVTEQYAKGEYTETTENDNSTKTIYIIGFFIGGAFALSYIYSFIIKRKVKNNPAMYGGSSSSGNFQFDFKDRVVRKMVAFWDESFKYQINNHIKLTEALESGMFYPKNYRTTGSDLIRGEVDGVTFRFSDLQIAREKTYVGKNEDPYETLLFGSFFIADFPKTFKYPVYVYPKSTFSNSTDTLRYEGDKVLLEDPEFMKQFNVYATDQIEARYILTPSLMERIKTMTTKMGKNLYIAFANNNIYVMNNNNKDRFEASWFKQLDKKESLLQFYNELAEQLSIINELKLNVNIWRS